MHFQLRYISVKELNMKRNYAAATKVLSGNISVFDDAGSSPKFLFRQHDGKRYTFLIKLFHDDRTVENMIALKTQLDIGGSHKGSIFEFAVPIGFNRLDYQDVLLLNTLEGCSLNTDCSFYILVYIYKAGCKSLQSIFEDNFFERIEKAQYLFNSRYRVKIADSLFTLYSILENIQFFFRGCKPYQVLHYDIKPENYLLDSFDNIYLVDLDQSGLYDIPKDRFVFPPTCKPYYFYFLPYEVDADITRASSLQDTENWENRVLYTERWLAWLLLFRVLTDIENPFWFVNSNKAEVVANFIKTNNIGDLFSEKTIACEIKYAYLTDTKKRRDTQMRIAHHLNSVVPENYKHAMNHVFIKGLTQFSARPNFYKISEIYYND